MLLNMQSSVLPNVWRYVTFDNIIELASSLEAKPLSDSPNSANQVALFRRRSLSVEGLDVKRTFVDWRKAFTIMALMSGKLPTQADIDSYCSKLRAQQEAAEDGLISKQAFAKVSTQANHLTLLRLF